MNLLKSSRILAVLVFCFFNLSSWAQKDMKYADFLLKYKNQSEVVVLDKSVLKIKNKKGDLSILKETYFESIILNETGINNFNEEF